MKKQERCWIYHESEEPIIIDKDDFAEWNKKGWEDSPAKFVKVTDFGVDKDDDLALQQIGDSVEGVKDALNGALNIDLMNKCELEEYAKKHFGVDIDRRKTLNKLRKEVKALINEG